MTVADQYEQLVNVQSAFARARHDRHLDERTSDGVVLGPLGRRALILATLAGPIGSRSDFLDGLLDEGVL